MAKKRPKTGEARRSNQPLKIDQLPPEIKDEILRLKKREFKTWEEIEQLSAAESFGEGKPGFIDWNTMPTFALELFPDMRLPHTTLHRWFDLRVSQVQRQVLHSAEQARVIAQVFAEAGVADDDSSILNAARDLIFTVISEGANSGERMKAVSALTSLAEVKQSARANDIKERKVSADERKLKMLERREAAAIAKMEAETEKLAKKAGNGGVITVEDINRIRERTFGLPPKQAV